MAKQQDGPAVPPWLTVFWKLGLTFNILRIIITIQNLRIDYQERPYRGQMPFPP